MLQFLHRHFLLICLVLFSVVVHWRAFTFEIYKDGDWQYYYPETLQSLFLPSTWLEAYGFGSEQFLLWKLPFNVAYWSVGISGFDSSVADALVVFIPIALGMPVAGYLLGRACSVSRLGSALVGLMFVSNTYFTALSTQGHHFLTLSALYGTTGLAFLIRFVSTGLTLRGLGSVLFLTLSLSADIRMFLVISLSAALFVFVQIVTKEVNIRPLFIKLTMIGGALLLLNLYWLSPTVMSAGNSAAAILQRDLFGDEFIDSRYALTMMHPFWRFGELVWFEQQIVPLGLWIYPIVTLLVFALMRKHTTTMWVGLIFVTGILLTKQSGEPWSSLYRTLFDTVPGFGAFRESTKFMYLMILAYALSLGLLLDIAAKKHGLLRYVLGSVVACAVCVTVWIQLPVIAGGIGAMTVPRTIPEDYLRLREFLRQDTESKFRTIVAPSLGSWMYYDNLRSLLPLTQLTDTDPLAQLDRSLPTRAKITQLLDNESFELILRSLAVKYVIVHSEQDFFGGKLYNELGVSRSYLISMLDSLPYLSKVTNIYFGDVTIYEYKFCCEYVNVFEGLISADTIDLYAHLTDEEKFRYLWELQGSSNPAQDTHHHLHLKRLDSALAAVQYKRIGHLRYQLEIENDTNSALITFSQGYSPDWKLVSESPDVSVSQIKGNGLVNAWLVSAKSGSLVGVGFTLYYAPQHYFLVGSALSVLSVPLTIFVFYRTKKAYA